MESKQDGGANGILGAADSSSSSGKRKAAETLEQPKLKQLRINGPPGKAAEPAKEAKSADPNDNFDKKWVPEDRSVGRYYWKPKDRETWLWDFFDHHTDFGKAWVQCKIPLDSKDRFGNPNVCLSWHKYSGSPSVLTNHAKTKKTHLAWYDQQVKSSGAADTSDSKKGGGQPKFFVGQLKRFHEALAIWIGTSLRPFTVVEDFGFKEMFQLLTGQANFELPSADTISQKCHVYGNEIRDKVFDSCLSSIS